MNKINKSFTVDDYSRIIKIMASQDNVKSAIRNSHDNNPWWPIDVKDWKIRMIIAGLSTRVSFRMLSTYEMVINKLKKIPFDELKEIPDKAILSIIKPLGLSDSRIKFIRSMIDFIESEQSIMDMKDDELIKLISNNVVGAGFKVGACCVLYARGYYCGIIPADSGIKDYLAPCIGLNTTKTPFGHELARYQFEEISAQLNLQQTARDLNYGDLNFPDNIALTWWYHLATINYKRYFCNNKKPDECPLKKDKKLSDKMGSMCSKNNPNLGGNKYIIIEGCDGVGKTTVVNSIKKYGFKNTHFPHDEKNKSIYNKYHEIMKLKFLHRSVFDRFFISEHVYGQVVRSTSRLTDNDFIQLLKMIQKTGGKIIYLKASFDTIKKRLLSREPTTKINNHSIHLLINKYNEIIQLSSKYCEVDIVNTNDMSPTQVVKKILSPKHSTVTTPTEVGIRFL